MLPAALMVLYSHLGKKEKKLAQILPVNETVSRVPGIEANTNILHLPITDGETVTGHL